MPPLESEKRCLQGRCFFLGKEKRLEPFCYTLSSKQTLGLCAALGSRCSFSAIRRIRLKLFQLYLTASRELVALVKTFEKEG